MSTDNHTGQEKRGWVLAALMMTMMLAAMDSTIVSTAIPHIVSDLGGFTKFSWVFSVYLLAQTVTIPLYGKFSDVFGRKKVLIFGIILFLIGSATSAAAWDIDSLILFRALQGLGAGSIMATVNTIAGDIYSVEERARVQGYLSSIWGISAIVGPALGGALAEYAHWRWIFLINIPVGILSIFFIVRYLKENIESQKIKVDYKGAVLILLSLSLLFLFLLEGGQSWAWISLPSLVLIVLVLLFGFWVYRVESVTEHAIMPMWIWRNKTLAFTNLAMVGMGVVLMGPETYLPTFTQASLGLETIASGFVLASVSFGWLFASAYSGHLYLKIGFRNTSIIGAFVLLIAAVGFILIPYPQRIWLIVLSQIVLGAGFGLLTTPALVGVQNMVSWKERGVVTGANIFSRNLGQSLGAAVAGAIFNNSFMQRVQSAPMELPSVSNDVLKTLHNPAFPEVGKEFIRHSIHFAMHHIYWGMILFTILIITALYFVPSMKLNEGRKTGQ